MELVVGLTFLQTSLIGWLLGGNTRQGNCVQKEKIVRLFNEMQSRMGMNGYSIQLRQSEKIPSVRATGLICFGLTGQITLSQKFMENLQDEEISAIFAHELSHLKHHDSLRLPAVLFVAQLVTTIALVMIFSVAPLVGFCVGTMIGIGVSFFVFSPYIEFEADKEASKVLTDKEIGVYIEYHGGGKADYSDSFHANSLLVVKMLEKELKSRRKTISLTT